jgi:tetratricopeptide (TPR) repeat protein
MDTSLNIFAFSKVFADCLWAELQQAATQAGNPLTNLVDFIRIEALSEKVTASKSSDKSHNRADNIASLVAQEHFMGRDDDLARITRLLEDNGRVVLTGAPAVGKSELALQWAQKVPANIRWWVDCGDSSSMMKDLLALAAIIDQPSMHEPFTLAADIVKDNPNCLLVFDNVKSVIDATRLVQLSRLGGRVVVISPITDGIASRDSIEIRPISTDASRALIAALLNDERPEAVGELATRLSGQPLLIWQAAAYIQDTGLGITKYLSLLDEHLEAMLERGLEARTAQPHLAKVWKESLSWAEREAKADVRTALCTLRLLGPSLVAHDIWQTAIAFAQGDNGELGGQPKVLDTIGALTRLRLVSPQETVRRVSSHSVLLEYVWSTASPEVRRMSATAVLASMKLIVQSARATGRNYVFEIVNPLWKLAVEHTDQVDRETLLETLIQTAAYAMEQEVPEVALSISQLALDDAIELEDATNLCFAASAHGSALIRLGELSIAQTYADGIVDSIPENAALSAQASVWTFASHASWLTNDITKSRDRAAEAVRLAAALQDKNTDRALLLSTAQYYLGRALMADGKHGDGADLMRQAIATLSVEPNNHLMLGVLQAEIRAEHRRQGVPFRISEPTSQSPDRPQEEDVERIALRSQVLADAEFLASKGEFAQAEEMLRDFMKHSMTGNSDIERTLRAELKQRLAGIIMDEQAERLAEIMLGEQLLAGNNERLDEAEQLLDSARADIEDIPSARKLLAGVFVNLGSLRLAQGRLPEAKELAEKALEIDASEHGPNHREYAHDAVFLGSVLLHMGENIRAKTWINKAIKIYDTPGPSRDASKSEEAKMLLLLSELTGG